MNHTSISLCIITKNEEHCLARCLDSVQKLVDEMIVVDTGSADNTVEIAAEHGASVFFFSWMDDFAAARNYAISKAYGNWILVLDADEVLAPLSRQELLEFIEQSPAEGYYFRICSYLDHGHEIIEDYVVRLFKNTAAYRFVGAIHEQIAGSIQSGNVNQGLIFAPFTIQHYGYLRKEMEDKHKFDRNTTVILKALLESPHDPFLHYCLGIEHLQKKDFQQAGQLFQKTLTLLRGTEGYIPQVLTALLLVQLTGPADADAEELFCKAIQALPDNGDIYYLYGVWLMRQKKFLDAAEVLKAAIGKNREMIEVGRLNTLLGDAYFLSGRCEQAIACYTNALCETSRELYPLVRILTIWGSGASPVLGEPLWEKLTPEITKVLLRRTLEAGMFDLALAVSLLTIVERTKANDIASVLTDCGSYRQILNKAPQADPLCTNIYAILSLGAEELLLKSQLFQLSCGQPNNVQQALIDGAMENLRLVSVLVGKVFPIGKITTACPEMAKYFS
ncbi:MAG TPA: glycosyltransferase [Negativicutes bacterium]